VETLARFKCGLPPHGHGIMSGTLLTYMKPLHEQSSILYTQAIDMGGIASGAAFFVNWASTQWGEVRPLFPYVSTSARLGEHTVLLLRYIYRCCHLFGRCSLDASAWKRCTLVVWAACAWSGIMLNTRSTHGMPLHGQGVIPDSQATKSTSTYLP